MFTSIIINGKKLAAERKRHGYHAADDLARRLGRATGTIRRYEGSGVVGIDPDIADELAKAFGGISADELAQRIGADEGEIARFQEMKREGKKPRPVKIDIPPDIADRLRAMLARDVTLPELVSAVLREWLREQATASSSSPAPAPSGTEELESRHPPDVVYQEYQGGELVEEALVHAPGPALHEPDAATRRRWAAQKTKRKTPKVSRGQRKGS